MKGVTLYAEKIKAFAKKAPWLYKIGAQAYYDKEYPRHLFIETTAKCNLSCAYCPRPDIDAHMDFELFKKIIDEASLYGARSFSLHLFGEPLLWPQIIDGIRYIKSRNRKHVVLLTTNGVYLERHLDALIRYDVDEIIWSWRKEAKFSENTLRRLKGWKKFRVRLIKEVTPKEEFERWSKWPKVEIRDLHNYGGTGLKTTKPEKRHPCYHLWYAPAVAWNGNILICCSDPHHREIIGNVKKQSVASAWKSMEKIRLSHMKGEFSGICANCDVYKSYPDIFFNWQKG